MKRTCCLARWRASQASQQDVTVTTHGDRYCPVTKLDCQEAVIWVNRGRALRAKPAAAGPALLSRSPSRTGMAGLAVAARLYLSNTRPGPVTRVPECGTIRNPPRRRPYYAAYRSSGIPTSESQQSGSPDLNPGASRPTTSRRSARPGCVQVPAWTWEGLSRPGVTPIRPPGPPSGCPDS